MPESNIKCELMIIGSGIAGMSASLFAAKNGIKTVQTGMTGELTFASGLIDLLGVYPVSESRIRMNPFNAINEVAADLPSHPLAKMSTSEISDAIDQFLTFLNDEGLVYHREPESNQRMITGVGTTRPAFCIPDSMIEGVKAYNDKRACLIIDIQGMKGFSSRQISETLKNSWPDISFASVSFPGAKGDVFGENIASSIENPDVLKQFAEAIIPHVKQNKTVGLPAILGIANSANVKADLERMLGVPVFEIPGLPPSVPGIRIKHAFEKGLAEKGVTLLSQKKVLSVQRAESGNFVFTVGRENNDDTCFIEAEAAVLATGRFLGKGLASDYTRVTETVFNLPVASPETRRDWHSKDFFDKNGHAINLAGIETDAYFRPVDASGSPIEANLFAAGSILANNDWKRLKSGAGSAIATGYAAINSYLKLRG